jgi:hypothetical protein
MVLLALVVLLVLTIILIKEREKYENYAIERPLEYFKNILDKNTVASTKISYTSSSVDPVVIAKHVAALFDNEYNIVSAKHVGIKTTNIILHRDDKMYGISIDVQIEHPPLKIIYNNVSMVSQDTFSLLSGRESQSDSQGHSQFDEKITKGVEFEKAFLADHYEKIKRYRGITVE